jgi:hypothetical protein
MKTAYKNHDGEWVVAERIKMSRYDLEGSVDSIKAALDEVRDRATAMGMVGEGSVDITLNRGFYSDDYEMEVEYFFTRYEYPAEMEKRLEREAKDKAAAAAKRKEAAQKRKLKNDPEYAEFERLKAKFGG